MFGKVLQALTRLNQRLDPEPVEQPAPQPQPIKWVRMDTLDFIIAYEAGELSDDQIIAGFQAMIDSGLAWQLQGHYGRTAQRLIDAGLCNIPVRETVGETEPQVV